MQRKLNTAWCRGFGRVNNLCLIFSSSNRRCDSRIAPSVFYTYTALYLYCATILTAFDKRENIKIMKKIINVALFLILLSLPALVLAHPGRTDSYGCHTCRTNCSSWGLSPGEYHCHYAKALPQPEEPIKSTYGAGGTGHTDPAPEYEKPTGNQVNVNLSANQNTNKNLNTNLNINPSAPSPRVLGNEYSEPIKNEEDNSWLGWVIGLGAAGAGGYWLAKRKK